MRRRGRRLRRVQVKSDILLTILQHGTVAYAVAVERLVPDDAILTAVAYDPKTRMLELTIYSDRFPELGDAALPPLVAGPEFLAMRGLA